MPSAHRTREIDAMRKPFVSALLALAACLVVAPARAGDQVSLAESEPASDAGTASPPALAADEGEGGGGDDSDTSRKPADEKDDRPAAKKGNKGSDPLLDEGRKKRIIKIVQRKEFLKFHRVEISPTLGGVTNDPFLVRLLLGANIAAHINEVFSLEWFAAYSPDTGVTDYKALTNQLLETSEVVPDISRVDFAGLMAMGFSPIFGKIELGTVKVINYDIYVTVGGGVVHTTDDKDVIPIHDPKYASQWHFATTFSFGFRIAFNQFFALRLEGRSLIHIEQVSRETPLNLEMKNNFGTTLGFSFFLPSRTRSLVR